LCPSNTHIHTDAPPCIRVIDQETDLLRIHTAYPQRYPFLLESVLYGTANARYDILFAFPGESLALDAYGKLHGQNQQINGNDFLDNFDRWWQDKSSISEAETPIPFSGGWFVYLGYELAGQIEPGLCLPLMSCDDKLPTACAVRIPAAIIVDHHSKTTVLVAEPAHHALLDDMDSDLSGVTGIEYDDRPCLSGAIKEDNPDAYLSGIARIKQYIHDGDVFQVNLSRAWRGELREHVDHAQIYQRLKRCNPAPFSGLCMLNDRAIISSSPERLVTVRGDVIETRPIAGTTPRLHPQENLERLNDKLLAHPKERAEHIMLIDLERNDLGRVCRPGTIEVNELLVLESYAHVHHLVSNVRGRTQQGIRPGQIIRAVFPGGTITGCPKVRCMEIIAELEQHPRKAYTGSMGYINRDGSMDLNILIRTIVKDGPHIILRAGAGIVADSIPEKELEETRAKARGMLKALL